MNQEAIIDRIRRLEGVDAMTATRESGAPEVAWGDTFFTYDPDHVLAATERLPFATIRDFSLLDTLLPHPAYARQHWVCILNPSANRFEHQVWGLLTEAHAAAAGRYRRRPKPRS